MNLNDIEVTVLNQMKKTLQGEVEFYLNDFVETELNIYLIDPAKAY